jgi:hypothetical protein
MCRQNRLSLKKIYKAFKPKTCLKGVILIVPIDDLHENPKLATM